MVNVTTRQIWRKKGIPAPGYRCVESWRCPVCGAPPDFLEEVSEKIPEAIRCGMCGFPFSLKACTGTGKGLFTPLPAHGEAWVVPWAYVYSTLRKADATEAVMKRVLHPSYIEVDPEFASKCGVQKEGA